MPGVRHQDVPNRQGLALIYIGPEAWDPNVHTGATMRVIAAIEDPRVARKILACLGLPARAPPVAPAREETLVSGPNDEDWHFDQSPVYDDT